jgi:hypothetical protein
VAFRIEASCDGLNFKALTDNNKDHAPIASNISICSSDWGDRHTSWVSGCTWLEDCDSSGAGESEISVEKDLDPNRSILYSLPQNSVSSSHIIKNPSCSSAGCMDFIRNEPSPGPPRNVEKPTIFPDLHLFPKRISGYKDECLISELTSENLTLHQDCRKLQSRVSDQQSTIEVMLEQAKRLLSEKEASDKLSLKLRDDIEETRRMMGDQLQCMEKKFQRACLEMKLMNTARIALEKELCDVRQISDLTRKAVQSAVQFEAVRAEELMLRNTRLDSACASAERAYSMLDNRSKHDRDVDTILSSVRIFLINLVEEIRYVSSTVEQDIQNRKSDINIIKQDDSAEMKIADKDKGEIELTQLKHTVEDLSTALTLKENQICNLFEEVNIAKACCFQVDESSTQNLSSSSSGSFPSEKELRRLKMTLEANHSTAKRREALIQNLRIENDILRTHATANETMKITPEILEEVSNLRCILSELQEKMKESGCYEQQCFSAERLGHESEIHGLQGVIDRLQIQIKELQNDFIGQLSLIAPDRNDSSRIDSDENFLRMKCIAERSVAITTARDEAMRAMQFKLIAADRKIAELQEMKQNLEGELSPRFETMICSWLSSVDSAFAKILGLESSLTSFHSAGKTVPSKEKMDSQILGCGSDSDFGKLKHLQLIGDDIIGVKYQDRSKSEEISLRDNELKMASENMCVGQQIGHGIRPIDANAGVDDKVYFI